jgi:hypothetical protein
MAVSIVTVPLPDVPEVEAILIQLSLVDADHAQVLVTVTWLWPPP